jgi:hypothetical protein
MPAANERFHASGGEARPKGSANLQVLHPAQTVVSRCLREAATTLYATREGHSNLTKTINLMNNVINKVINNKK